MSDIDDRMKKAIDALDKELATIRTGRANPGMLDRVNVNYYGTPTPIKNMANISVTDGRTLIIQPFDASSIKDMEKAIQESDLGLTPNNDGKRLLIIVPELTKERRAELAKLVKKESENAKVAVRNIRRDEMDKIKKSTEGSEDERKDQQDQVQKKTDDYIKKIDDIAIAKEKEIMTI
jgi:ribosome recycling factor